MEKPSRKAERTRNFIIEKTAAIFNKKGYAGTSLTDLTLATGLTKGSIYGNFENKEEVALAAFDYNYGNVNQVIRQQMLNAETYYDKLTVYTKVYDQLLANNFPEGGCPILNTSTEADDTHELLKDRAAKAILTWKKNMQQLIQAGVEAGEFKKQEDDSALAISIIALIEGGMMIARVTGDHNEMGKVMMTVEILLKQIKLT
ncbi:TetR/AcrR family transcriptional regulator [Pedobacter sp. AW31-3R]|uniref:TetR/AcrR family transcriptional regulator n=1 Tax=Pedobacter sp. AW31-3R TaxID=3445781 RepID=UPI003FA1822F